MKKIILFTILIALLVSMMIACVPKKNLPTDEEWENYLAWEEEFLQWRDGPAVEQCVYQLQHSTTYEIYHIGSLQECKDMQDAHPDSIIMPYN